MFGCHLKLSAYVMFHQLSEKRIVLIRQQIVKPDSGTDKDLFYPGEGAQLLQKQSVILMIRL